MDVDGGVVIARDLIAVPPTGLDTLRLTHQTQRAPPPGQSVPRGPPLRHQGRGGELAGPHRLRELERAQVLAEERRETLHIRRGRGEPHYAAGRRSMPVHQAALELHDAQVTCREEVTELGQERCERHEQQAMILKLTDELTAAAEALGRTASAANLGGTPGEHIEHGELRVAEAPCK